jgi:hypothetical protein
MFSPFFWLAAESCDSHSIDRLYLKMFGSATRLRLSLVTTWPSPAVLGPTRNYRGGGTALNTSEAEL